MKKTQGASVPTTVYLLCAHTVRDIPGWLRERACQYKPRDSLCQVITCLCRAHRQPGQKVKDPNQLLTAPALSTCKPPLLCPCASLRASMDGCATKSRLWIEDKSSKVGQNQARPKAWRSIAGNKDLGLKDKLLGSHTPLRPIFQTFKDYSDGHFIYK